MWDCNGWATCPVVLPYPATHSGPAQPFLLILLPRVACPCPSVCWRDRAGILVRNHAEHKDDPSAPSTRPFAQNVSRPMTSFTVCPGTSFTVLSRLLYPEASVRRL